MAQVRLITPYAAFPDVQFASGLPSYRQMALQLRLRAYGVQIPCFMDSIKQTIGKNGPIGRPRDKKKRARNVFIPYWPKNFQGITIQMIEDTSAFEKMLVKDGYTCGFCGKICKTRAGLKRHTRSCSEFKSPSSSFRHSKPISSKRRKPASDSVERSKNGMP